VYEDRFPVFSHAGSENPNKRRRQVSQNFSFHENYRDGEAIEAGSDRSFGYTVGTILMVIGAAKAFVAGALPPVACLIFAAGVLLLLLGFVAPSRLSALNRIWLKMGTVISKVVNPIVLALLFFLVVTPMAFVMRIVGKRPLHLAPDRTAATYWIKREPPEGEASNMRRQF
jgi:large-conductance mechanosensitive channel